MSTFADELQKGQLGEGEISKWLVSRGNSVLPVFETEQAYKGPRAFTPMGQVTAPDMFVFNDKQAMWIEAKTKTTFGWNYTKRIFTTGIDLHHFGEYQKIQELSSMPVYLFFLQRPGTTPPGAPCESPSGLFGGELEYLVKNFDHKSDKYASGMVYWDHDKLTRYATTEELNAL